MESSHISKLHNTHTHLGERVGYRGQSLFITDAGGKRVVLIQCDWIM